jgi:hypothetical protein
MRSAWRSTVSQMRQGVLQLGLGVMDGGGNIVLRVA